MFTIGSSTRVFLAGFILGIVVASVGASGLLRILDKGVEYVRINSSELAK